MRKPRVRFVVIVLVGLSLVLASWACGSRGPGSAPEHTAPTHGRSATPTVAPMLTPEQRQTSQIAYVSSDGNLWVIRDDGSGVRRLTSDGGNTSPRWSPDGRWIAFLHREPASGEILVLMNSDGSNRTRVSESFPGFPFPDQSAELSNVRWSADGCTLYVHIAPGPVSMHPIHAVPLCGGTAADASFAHFFDVRSDGVFARAVAGAVSPIG